jgi:hypothetical protein
MTRREREVLNGIRGQPDIALRLTDGEPDPALISAAGPAQDWISVAAWQLPRLLGDETPEDLHRAKMAIDRAQEREQARRPA